MVLCLYRLQCMAYRKPHLCLGERTRGVRVSQGMLRASVERAARANTTSIPLHQWHSDPVGYCIWFRLQGQKSAQILMLM